MWTRKQARAALIATVVGAAASSAVGQSADFGIVDEPSYQEFLRAVRAAEYIREDYIVGVVPDVCPRDNEDFEELSTPGTKPRVVGTVAATLAFVERNPSAGSSAIEEFIAAFDAALQAAAPEDTDLLRPANFLHAMAHTRVVGDLDDSTLNSIVGFDTDVGDRALELLAVTVPGPDGFLAVQNRMVRHQRATTRDFGSRPEFGSLLVHGLLNQDPGGAEVNEDLGLELRQYLNANGYWAAWGQGVRPELCGVNDAIDAMPQTYADYLTAISTPLDPDVSDGIDNPHQARIVTAINDAFGYSQDIIDQMADLLANEPTLYEGVDLAEDQAYVDLVTAGIIADLRASSGSRAAVFGNSLIMMQSDYDDLGVATYGQQQLDFGSAVLGVNKKYAYAKSGVRIVGSIAVIGASVAQGPDGAASGIAAATDIVCESLDIASTASNGVTPDDIYDQVLRMRLQLAEMQAQLNERFDRVEARLDLIYGSMMDGLYALGDQIGDLQDDVSELIREVYISHSQLSRMEASLFGVAEDVLLQDFTQDADVYLDFRIDGVNDLPYDVGDPNFRSGASYMFTFTTTTATSEPFAGSRSNPFELADADETVGSAPRARYLNDLVVNAQLFGVPALSTQTVVGPEAWAQGASAYVQLAAENPWYFAYMYGSQYDAWQDDPDGQSPPDLQVIIDKGEDLIDVIDAARNATLFDNLVANYESAAANLQAAVDARIVELLEDYQPVALSNGSTSVNLWTQDGLQNVKALTPRLERWLPNGGSENYALNLPNSGGHNGYQSVTGANQDRAKRADLRSLLLANLNGGTFREAIYLSEGGNTPSTHVLLPHDGGSNSQDWNQERYRILYYDRFRWSNQFQAWILDQPGDDAAARKFVHRMWSEIKDDIIEGTSIEGIEYIKDNDVLERLVVWSDVRNGKDDATIDADTATLLHDLRANYVRPAIAFDMTTPGNPIHDAMRALDDAEAILDAYVTLAMPGALEVSEVLSSGLHSVPGTSDIGLRSEDVLALMNQFEAADDEFLDDWGDPLFDLPGINGILEVRVAELHDEINRGLDDLSLEASPYLEWMLAETRALRSHASRLAVDDFYLVDGRLFKGSSVLDNDVWQASGADEFRPIEIDPDFGPGDDGYLAPEHGGLVLNPDGTFIYIADAGYSGSDYFSYRARCDISDDGAGAYAFSEPAIARLRVDGSSGSTSEESEASFGSATQIEP